MNLFRILLSRFFEKKNSFVFLLSLFLGLSSCSSLRNYSLHSGDLVFVSAGTTSLSSAIDRVTRTQEQTHFSHVALLEKEKGEFWILEATTPHGSQRISWESFMTKEKKEGNSVFIYRLKKEYQNSILSAIKTAKTMLGKPYNYSYVLREDQYYCSDFVQRSFHTDSIFSLYPMTFINPKTGQIDATWVDFYQKLGMSVPQGKPGCNPNGMASATSLVFVKKLF